MADEQSKHQVTPVVFIHGLWLHARSWDLWVKLFRRLGYETMAPKWPGESDDIEETRLAPEAVAGLGTEELTDYFVKKIAVLDRRPVVIGHSFGGLIAQKLLGMGMATAAIAIAPVQTKGVWALSPRQIAAAWPALRHVLSPGRAVALTADEFRYAFGNAISREESAELYTMWSIPSPVRPLFQAVFANIAPQAATKVNAQAAERGPLLLIAGDRDNTVPASVVRAQQRLYTISPAVTDIQEFADRGHSLHIDNGWRDVADATVEWLKFRVHNTKRQ